MQRRTALIGLATALTAPTLTASPVAVAGQTEVIQLTAPRGRRFEVRLRWPRGAKGPLPLIVFSHGLSSNMDAFSRTSEAWVRAGYITAHPTHADSIRPSPLRTKLGEDLAIVMRQLATSTNDTTARADLVRKLEDPAYLESRISDIKRLLSAGLDGHGWPNGAPIVDRRRIGMAGHSYGAYTTMALGGAQIFTTTNASDFSDTRFGALMVISGQGPGRMGLRANSFDRLLRPTLWVSGSKDYGANGETPEWRLEPWRLSPPRDKYKVFVEGARHVDFDAPPNQPEATDTLHAREICFWNAYLKSSHTAREGITAPTPDGITILKRTS